jgi:spore maturation protein SpmA
MFLVLNTSGLTLLPISIMVYRAQLGAVNPSDIFIPILLATYFSTIAGLIAVAVYQKINLLDKVILAYLGGLTLIIAGIIWYFSTLGRDEVTYVSNLASNFILFTVIIAFIVMALLKKVNVYETFIDGAKDGFKTAVKIIPTWWQYWLPLVFSGPQAPWNGWLKAFHGLLTRQASIPILPGTCLRH